MRWPAPPDGDSAGPKDAEALRGEWEKTIAKDAVDKFFPKKVGAMDCGNAAIELIHEVVQKGDELFIEHLDLIFKWFTLRLGEREMTPTLVRMLEVLGGCLENLHARGYELLDLNEHTHTVRVRVERGEQVPHRGWLPGNHGDHQRGVPGQEVQPAKSKRIKEPCSNSPT